MSILQSLKNAKVSSHRSRELSIRLSTAFAIRGRKRLFTVLWTVLPHTHLHPHPHLHSHPHSAAPLFRLVYPTSYPTRIVTRHILFTTLYCTHAESVMLLLVHFADKL